MIRERIICLTALMVGILVGWLLGTAYTHDLVHQYERDRAYFEDCLSARRLECTVLKVRISQLNTEQAMLYHILREEGGYDE